MSCQRKPPRVTLAWGLLTLALVATGVGGQEEPPKGPGGLAQIEERLSSAAGEERVELLLQLAVLHFDERRHDAILAPAEEALAWFDAAPSSDQRKVLTLCKVLMHAYAFQRQLSLAVAIGRRAERLAEEIGHTEERAFIAKRLGDTYRYLADYPTAIAYYDRAQPLYEQLKDYEGLGNVLNNNSIVYEARGEFAEAIRLTLAARKVYQQAGDLQGVSLTLGNLGSLYDQLGLDQEALANFNEGVAAALAAGIGSEGTLADNRTMLGEFHRRRGNHAEARSYLRGALEYFEKQNRTNRLIEVELLLGQAELAAGNFAIGSAHVEKALAAANNSETPIVRADGWRQIARVYPDRAGDLLESALAVYREHGHQVLMSATLADLVKVYSSQNRHQDALAALQEKSALDRLVFSAETQQELAKMQARFEFQEKEQKIAILTKDKALQEIELKRQAQFQLALLASFVGLLTLLGLLFNRYRLGIRNAQAETSLALEREMNARLQQIDRLKDQFLANTSHELRTPLYGIIGLAESIRSSSESGLSAAANEQLSSIVASAKRLHSQVGNVLDFSGICAGELSLMRRAVDLPSLVAEVLALAAPLIADKKVILRSRLAPDLPKVDADPRRLEQILLNLTSNAIQFTDSGEVEIHAQLEGKAVSIAVRDTGSGIRKEDQERVFHAFEQVDGSPERRHGGAGLGLSVSRELVRLHGGDIELTSVEGQGSTFAFSLPVAEGALLPLQLGNSGIADLVSSAQSGRQAPAAPTAPSPDTWILVVDDEPVNRLVLEHQLLAAGYGVKLAADGFQALEQTERESVDLVLLDVMMPRFSGYEVCRKLRERYSRHELPVIFITALSGAGDVAEGLAAGGNDYLSKPVAMTELLARIRTQIELKSDLREGSIGA